MDAESAWERLDHRFRLCLERAWVSLGRRGLPVGAVVARAEEVVSEGRNRVYDAPGGFDPLQRTPLAHAEMNAVATLPEGVEVADHDVWSTHSPCSMCRAMIEFVGFSGVHYLAPDPSTEESPVSARRPDAVESVWLVVANGLFLHDVAWVGGNDNPIVTRGAAREPEITTLAVRLVEAETLIRALANGADILDGLSASAIWDQILEATHDRSTRG